jgi:flagellar hook assembly protein FlgD
MNVRSSNGGNSSISLSGKGEVPGGVIDAVEAGISAWPNPMTDRVEVRFSKPTPAMNVSVVSTSGATVAAFTHDGVEAGGSIRWNGRDAAGSLVASGTYTMIIRYGENIVTVPLTIVK